MMNARNIVALILILISLACLYPGLTQDIFSLKVGTTLPIVGELNLHESTQSVVSTIKELNHQDNKLVAFLILLFSIIVPILKAVLLLAVLLVKPLKRKGTIYNFVALISKWSMADVFVVGVLLAFLSTRSDDSITSSLHNGFYYFLAYCIISIIAVQLIDKKQFIDG